MIIQNLKLAFKLK